jgi:DNA-binding Lrp family transcriptional regulator
VRQILELLERDAQLSPDTIATMLDLPVEEVREAIAGWEASGAIRRYRAVIDWDKVAASPYGAIISGFKFDKDSGVLVDFERDSALQAIAQLRDMHGFKAVTKTEHAGKDGGPIEVAAYSDAERAKALQAFLIKAKQQNAG